MMRHSFSSRDDTVVKLCVVFALLLLHVKCETVQKLDGESFFGDKICDVHQRIKSNCSTRMRPTRSHLECVALCSGDSACVGASTDNSGVCFHHQKCPDLTGCGVEEKNHDFKVRRCFKGRVRDSNTMICKCTGTWSRLRGRCCEMVQVRCCHELLELEYVSGDYEVILDLGKEGIQPFTALCCVDRQRGFAQVVVLRNQGTNSFNKTFKEYRSGFIFDRHNLWLGLDHWSSLTRAGFNRVEIKLKFSNYKNEYRVYTGFKMKGASGNFVYDYEASTEWIDVGGEPIGYRFGDCLAAGKGLSYFSTVDNDNDGDPSLNCASILGSGWWYPPSCKPLSCNLLGRSWNQDVSTPKDERISILEMDMEVVGLSLLRIDIYVSDESFQQYDY